MSAGAGAHIKHWHQLREDGEMGTNADVRLGTLF